VREARIESRESIQRRLSGYFYELADRRADSNAIDGAHLEAVRGGTERAVVDEDAMDNGSDGLCPVAIDDSRQHLVEMRSLMICPGMLRSLEYEFDHGVH